MNAAFYKAHQCVGDGWTRQLVNHFLTVVECGAPDADILQIKEKFGTLRIYLSGPEWLEELAVMYERLSEVCCEDCGVWHGQYDERKGTGPLRESHYAIVSTGPLPSQGWIKTLCTVCRDQRQAEWDLKAKDRSGDVA